MSRGHGGLMATFFPLEAQGTFERTCGAKLACRA
jgi:hypothetical protein